MPSTPRLLQVLALGAALLLLVLLALHLRQPPPAASTHFPSSEPPQTILALNPTFAPSAFASVRSAAELHASLENTLLVRDARPHEAVLTFANAGAYARFLARAQHRGLAVLGQLDRLLTVRIRYESLSALEAELLEHAADYATIGANHLVHIPAPPAKVDRATAHEIPFRNDTLSFLGVAADHTTWGRGTTIAILDSGVAPDSTFGSGRVQYLNIGLGTVPGTNANDGHGTSVAALAAGASADAAGIAPAATVLSIRVTDTNGTSDIFTVSQAILAAVDAGAPIINLSLGGYTTNTALNSAIAYAH
ncbi:MAG TPA: S8 family serine peptidase, partial [Opitutus sp.]|nr:S8 family serine peptidase [Opitutus sp.]